MGKKLLVFLAPFIVYSPTLSGAFYYDDNVIFFGHQVARLAENPFLVFSEDMHFLPGAPRSIHVFFLLLIYKLFGPNPFPYHLFNLLLHSATTLLVYIFLKDIMNRYRGVSEPSKPDAVPPLLGGLLFGLHPVHLENIAFVSLGGTDLFYTFWAMLSLVLYVRFRYARSQGVSRPRLILLALSASAFYLSLLSKESSVVFILVYPLLEIFVVGSETGVLRALRSSLWAAPHIGLLLYYKRGFVFGAVPTAVSMLGGAGRTGSGISGPEAVFKSLGFFMKSLVFPYPHLPFIKEFGSAAVLYSFAGAAVIFLAASFLLRKRAFVFAMSWIFAVSAPYLLVPLTGSNVAITAERYIYAPSVGFAALAAFLAAGARRRFVLPFGSVVIILYSALGIGYYFEAWRSEESFWRYAVRTNPDYVSGYVSLSSIELNKGNVEEARALLLEGLEKPKGLPAEFSQTAYSLGSIARQGGDLGGAESYYLLSLRYGPFEFSYIDLGFLYLETGRPDAARWAFEGALSFPQQNPRALLGMAAACDLAGDREGARRFAMQVLERARDKRLRGLAMELLR